LARLGPRRQPSRLPWWLEIGVLAAVYNLFEYVRSLSEGTPSAALHNAKAVIAIERATWTFHEARVQRWVLPHHFFVEILDFFYGTVHFVSPPLALLLLWRRAPARYAHWRSALVLSSVIGLAGFWLYPLTPPRLLPAQYHFVDTMRTIGGLGVLDSGKFKDTNAFAAMPSLHVAWATWSAAALVLTTRSWWARALAVAYPVATMFVIVATANHYVADGVGGWIVLVGAFALSTRLYGRRRGRRVRPLPPTPAPVPALPALAPASPARAPRSNLTANSA